MSETKRPGARPTPWLVCRHRRPGAPVRLYCFPHSGGSPGEYVRWADDLPDVEVLGVQLPGRGSRLMDEPLTSLPDVLDRLLDSAVFEPPFAFFGHSMGGLTAYETARRLAELGLPQPRFVMTSACTPPGHPRDNGLRALPDAELLAAVDGRFGGGLPPDLGEDAALRDLIMRSMRADITLSETYVPLPGPSWSGPLHAVGGRQDLPEEVLARWKEFTPGPFSLTMLPGGHFYFRDPAQRRSLLSHLAGLLAEARE
ncbi:thioesterase II family protein [Streptomyces sp. NRRL F-5727]|uniref:thioesterase II family protein n=1 Tax=Streptomyces sp. NRRL F-5727 TaxID=1463871 RepID=UPI00068D3C69|nr:alpha/beta fold hydrolase [Streptomyces sp. NRRL F-5727]